MKRPGNHRWLGGMTVTAAALAMAATAAASHPALIRSSTFDSSGEGWVAFDGSSVSSPTWQVSGGNPNGYIAGDFVSGVGDMQSVPHGGGSTWTPGNALGDYGGTVRADVRVSLNGSSNTEDLVIGFASDNAAADVCDDVGTPTSSWATYSLTLDASHLVQCLSGKPLTAAQVSAELAGFDGMFVLARNQDKVEEVVGVDNAELSPPQIAETPPTGKIKRTLALQGTGRKLTGALVAPDDFSCAATMKVTIFQKGKKPVKVGTVKTFTIPHASGLWLFRLVVKKATGKYYATVAQASSKLDGNTCAAARSSTVKVH